MATQTQQKTIWELREEEKICVLDLDDVLSKSIEHWVEFVNTQKIPNTKIFRNLNELKCGISYNKYKDLKFIYRESNEKLKIKPAKDASKFTTELKNLGYIIIILTRRPLNIHKNLFSLTKTWLEKNNIKYDAIIFNDKKHLDILNNFENIGFFVEDNRYICNTIARFNIKCFLIDNLYNQGKLNKNVKRVNNLMEILKWIKK